MNHWIPLSIRNYASKHHRIGWSKPKQSRNKTLASYSSHDSIHFIPILFRTFFSLSEGAYISSPKLKNHFRRMHFIFSRRWKKQQTDLNETKKNKENLYRAYEYLSPRQNFNSNKKHRTVLEGFCIAWYSTKLYKWGARKNDKDKKYSSSLSGTHTCTNVCKLKILLKLN